jgi:hypothetical protein
MAIDWKKRNGHLYVRDVQPEGAWILIVNGKGRKVHPGAGQNLFKPGAAHPTGIPDYDDIPLGKDLLDDACLVTSSDGTKPSFLLDQDGMWYISPAAAQHYPFDGGDRRLKTLDPVVFSHLKQVGSIEPPS